MKRSLLAAIVLFCTASYLFCDGIGIYTPDRNGYMAQDGSAYGNEENTCASNTYPVGSILNIKTEDGGDVLVYVNDTSEMPPDRQILLNMKAAEELGIADKGFASRQVSVVLEGEETEADTGWSKFRIGTFKTNSEALDAYKTLVANSLKATAMATENGVELYVRYIPQYQVETVRNVLEGMGYKDTVRMIEENPYS